MGLRGNQVDPVGQTLPPDDLLDLGQVVLAPGATGPPDDDEMGVGKSVQGSQRPDGHIGTLQRLDPSHEEQDRDSGRKSESPPGLGPVTGPECR